MERIITISFISGTIGSACGLLVGWHMMMQHSMSFVVLMSTFVCFIVYMLIFTMLARHKR